MSPRSGRESRIKVSGWALYPLIGAFVALKLAGVTDWSWWWVLSPLWIGAAVLVLLAGGLLLAFGLFAVYARIRLRFRLRQAFPEIFINPATWSRIASDPPDDY